MSENLCISSWITHPANRDRASLNGGEYNPIATIIHWEHQMREQPGLKVILDLDENLFDTATYWVQVSNRVLSRTGQISSDRLPTPETVMAAGGPSSYYPKFFPEFFPTFEAYEMLADELRHRFSGNNRGPATADIPTIIHVVKSKATLLGGLTARPDTKVVKRATEEQLRNAGIDPAEFEILYKPEPVPVSQSSREKMNILSALANTQDVNGYIVLIDDSISTATKIRDYNRLRGSKRPIIQIVFGGGSLTKPKIEAGQFTEDRDNGIFLMHDWSKLSPILDEVTQWTNSLPLSSSVTPTSM